MTFKAAPDGRSVIVSCHLRNEGQGTISQVLFPDLQGLRPTDDPDVMELRMALGAVNPFATPVRPAGRARYYPRSYGSVSPSSQFTRCTLCGGSIWAV